jgi:cytochrome c-type biogenesis protein CcmH
MTADYAIWLAIAVLALVSLAPLALSLRRSAAARSRQEAAVELHRAQLTELDRDLAEGRILPVEHANAVLEVQRRLLTAAGSSENAPRSGTASPVLIALIVLPIGALALYLTGGSPDLPAEPLADRIAAAKARDQRDAILIDDLRRKLSEMDPHSDQARRGYELLGNAEASRGRLKEAADAWQIALAVRFDPTLAAEAGEAITEVNGQVTDEAAALFRRALDESPADAPWRPMAEKRLGETKKP